MDTFTVAEIGLLFFLLHFQNFQNCLRSLVVGLNALFAPLPEHDFFLYFHFLSLKLCAATDFIWVIN